MNTSRPPAGTVEFIYQHTREALNGQVAQARGIDAKIAQLFAAGTIVLGLAGTSALTKAPGSVVVASVAAYVVALGLAAMAMYPIRLRGSDYGATIWDEHWYRPPSEIQHSVVEDVAEGAKHNERVLDLKARLLVAVLLAVGTEATLVGVGLIVPRLTA